MIVRLMGEGQYEIDRRYMDEINKLDNSIVKFVEKGDEKAFKAEFKKLVDFVRRHGEKLPEDVLKPSDIIAPPADITLEEAGKIFKGEGLVPD